MPSFTNDKIVFWKYSKGLSFEKLCSFQLKDAYDNFEVALEIPLNDFSVYFWDEQILRMDNSVYESQNYSNKFMQIEKDSDLGSLFFSVVINDKIVFNGLNRVMLLSAAMRSYDDSKYPRITMWARNNNSVFFRFTYRPTLSRLSIWDMPENLGDVKLLFAGEILNYFESSGKIQKGRFDIQDFCVKEQLTIFPFLAP